MPLRAELPVAHATLRVLLRASCFAAAVAPSAARLAEARRSRPEHGEATAVFRQLDVDGSGDLSWDELARYLESAGKTATPAASRRMMRLADKDYSWSLDSKEFQECAADLDQCLPPISLQRMKRNRVKSPKAKGSIEQEAVGGLSAEMTSEHMEAEAEVQEHVSSTQESLDSITEAVRTRGIDMVRLGGAVFQLVVSSGVDTVQKLVLDLKHGDGDVRAGEDVSADVNMTMGEQELSALSQGHLDTLQALHNGKLKVQGNVDAAVRLGKILKYASETLSFKDKVFVPTRATAAAAGRQRMQQRHIERGSVDSEAMPGQPKPMVVRLSHREATPDFEA